MAKTCFTNDCVNIARPKEKFCSKCASRRYRENNKVKAAYIILHTNALRRGIMFNLTFEHWKFFCKKTNYLNLKGTSADSMTVDRININNGYADGNIQMITLSENIKKYRKDLLMKTWGHGKQAGDPF